MRSFAKNVAIGVGISLLLGATGAAIATAPAGMLDVVNTYYSNANHTAVVGSVEYDCSGRRTQLGQTTMFQTYVTNECPGSGGQPGGGADGGGDTFYNCAFITTPYPVYVCHP